MDILVKDVSHTFSQAGLQSEVLKALTCQFSASDITALVGPSGSGKSTFLSLIGRAGFSPTNRLAISTRSTGR